MIDNTKKIILDNKDAIEKLANKDCGNDKSSKACLEEKIKQSKRIILQIAEEIQRAFQVDSLKPVQAHVGARPLARHPNLKRAAHQPRPLGASV